MNAGGWREQAAPSLEAIAEIAQAAFAALPATFRRQAGEIVFRVDDFPAQEVLHELGLEDPFELTGLYQGVDLTRRSVHDVPLQPARVFLYRRPILDEWIDRGDVSLAEIVTHVLVHEIGHHFGLSDADIARLEDEAE